MPGGYHDWHRNTCMTGSPPERRASVATPRSRARAHPSRRRVSKPPPAPQTCGGGVDMATPGLRRGHRKTEGAQVARLHAAVSRMCRCVCVCVLPRAQSPGHLPRVLAHALTEPGACTGCRLSPTALPPPRKDLNCRRADVQGHGLRPKAPGARHRRESMAALHTAATSGCRNCGFTCAAGDIERKQHRPTGARVLLTLRAPQHVAVAVGPTCVCVCAMRVKGP